MGEHKLNLSAVRSMKPGDVKSDKGTGSVRGFVVRCQGDAKVFTLRFRLYGKQHTYTIGRLGETTAKLELPCTVENARREAEWARGEVVAGRNPIDTAKRSNSENSVEAVVNDYMARHVRARNLRTADEIEALFAHHVTPRWGKRHIRSIKRADVVKLLDEVADDAGSGAARNVRMRITSLFKFAIGRGAGGVEGSPMVGVPNPHRLVRKDRVLSDAEIAVAWSVFEDVGRPFGPVLKLALVLGQRRTEIAEMRRADISETPDGPVWTIPGSATKAGRVHLVPLPALAVEIIGAQPKRGPYVFTTHEKGERPVSGFSRAKRIADARIAEKIAKRKADGEDTTGLFAEPWTIHDLRRTVATGLPALGADRHTVERILNHADPSVTGTYDRYAYLAEKRAALAAWENKLRSLLGLCTTKPELEGATRAA